MEYFLAAITGYLLGSLPTAYLLLKKSKGIDITKSGSGNVGAMNSYEITNSKVTGIIVLLIDALKGILSVFILLTIYPGDFSYPALALIFAVFSHCFNPWINFNGGRGLATAAGGALVIFPFMIAVWLILWLIVYVMKKDILLSNIASTILSLLLTFSSANIAIKYANPLPESVSVLLFFTTSVLLIIFIKHIEPLKEFINNYKRANRK